MMHSQRALVCEMMIPLTMINSMIVLIESSSLIFHFPSPQMMTAEGWGGRFFFHALPDEPKQLLPAMIASSPFEKCHQVVIIRRGRAIHKNTTQVFIFTRVVATSELMRLFVIALIASLAIGTAFAVGGTPGVSDCLCSDDKARLEALVKSAAGSDGKFNGNAMSAHHGLAVLTMLKVDLGTTTGPCSTAKSVASNPTDVKALYHAASVGVAANCPIEVS